MPEIGLVGGAYAENPGVNPSTCINWYPAPAGPGGKVPAVLKPVSGKALWSSQGGSPIRGLHEFAGLLYVPVGDTVKAIELDATSSDVVGTLGTSSGRVSMADNGKVVCVVDGQDGWLLAPNGVSGGAPPWAPHAVTLGEFIRPSGDNPGPAVFECTDVGGGYSYGPEPDWLTEMPSVGSTYTQPNGGPEWTRRIQQFVQITDSDFPSPTQVVFCNGWFVFDIPGSPGQFGVSDLYATDPADFFDRLDFATAEGSPDDLVRIFAIGRTLWLLGANTTEVWFPMDNAAFPFAPDLSLMMQRGCAAKWSAANVGEALFWLSRDQQGRLQVVGSTGGPAEVISTPFIEAEINGYSTIDDAEGIAWHQDGITHYKLTFPTENRTWVYTPQTGLWYRQARWAGGAWQRDNYTFFAEFSGRLLVGHRTTGDLCYLDPDVRTEYDNGNHYAIRQERVCPLVSANGRHMIFEAIQIDLAAGTDALSVADPKILLDWSDDGGRTWRPSTALSHDLPTDGSKPARAIFRPLGYGTSRAFRVIVEDQGASVAPGEGPDITLIGGYLDARTTNGRL